MTWGKTVNKKKSKFPSWEFPKTCSKWKDSPLPTKKTTNPSRKWGKPTTKKFEPIKTLNTKDVSHVTSKTWKHYDLFEKVYSQVSFD